MSTTVQLEPADAPALEMPENAPAVESAEPKAAEEPQWTAADIIGPTDAYSVAGVAKWLIIDDHALRQAIADQPCGRQHRIDETFVLFGKHILRAIEVAKLAYQLTERAKAVLRRRAEQERTREAARNRELTPADVIEPGQRMRLHAIADYLAIPLRSLVQAVEQRQLRTESGHDSGGNAVIAGAHLLEWIENQKIAWKITAWARRCYRVKHPEVAMEETEPVPELLDQVGEAIERERQAQEQAAREAREHALGQYIALLQRADAPEEDDCDTLRALMDTLSLAMPDIERDLKAVAAAQKLTARFNDSSTCGNAGYTQQLRTALADMAKSNKHLFDLAADPPRLRCKAAEEQATANQG